MCTAFRNPQWNMNQATESPLRPSVPALNKDYGTYLAPVGAPFPSASLSESKNAVQDSNAAQIMLEPARQPHTGHGTRLPSIRWAQPWTSGPNNWASWHVHLAQGDTLIATAGEQLVPNEGKPPLAAAIKTTRTAWQALQQLPC